MSQSGHACYMARRRDGSTRGGGKDREGMMADVEQLLWMAIYFGLALIALGLVVTMIRKRR